VKSKFVGAPQQLDRHTLRTKLRRLLEKQRTCRISETKVFLRFDTCLCSSAPPQDQKKKHISPAGFLGSALGLLFLPMGFSVFASGIHCVWFFPMGLIRA
jgi:hypothetical protein